MKVLIVANPNSIWTKYYIEQILLKHAEFELFIQDDPNENNRFKEFYEQAGVQLIGKYELNPLVMRIPRLRALYWLYKRKKAIKNKYDLVIVISSTLENIMVAQYAKKKCGKIIDLVIGSDILRASKKRIAIIDKLLLKNKAIIVCSAQKPANYIAEKMRSGKVLGNTVVSFGLVTMSKIDQHRKDDVNILRKEMGINTSKVTICIGYNGSEKQQHEKVIKELTQLGETDKERCFLVLPMTYGLKNDYYTRIIDWLDKSGYEYAVLTRFLDFEDVAKMWLSMDIFINAQETDAMSASFVECIYSGAYILNASWLRYPELDKRGVLLDTFNEFAELPIKVTEYLETAKNKDMTNASKFNCIEEYQRFQQAWEDIFLNEGITNRKLNKE